MFLASPITFPNLGITVDPSPVAFTVFGKDIYWYGIIIASGFLLAVLYMLHRAKDFGVTQDDVLDMILWAVPIGVVCARLYYCIFYWELYEDDPISMLYIWEGGLAIYGGIIGGFLGVLLVCRRKKKPLFAVLDCIAPGVMIGQLVGRWGNFVNAEAYGVIGPYDFLGHTFDATSFAAHNPFIMTINNMYVHPTFLYESVWNLIGFLLINAFWKHKKYNGQILLLYLTWYGFGRAVIEGFRGDSLYIGSLRISQLLAFLCFAFGVLLLIAFAVIKPQKKAKDSAEQTA